MFTQLPFRIGKIWSKTIETEDIYAVLNKEKLGRHFCKTLYRPTLILS